MGNAKSIISPGLINLVLIECLFLALVVYLGLCLWAGMPVTVTDGIAGFVAGVLLILTSIRQSDS